MSILQSVPLPPLLTILVAVSFGDQASPPDDRAASVGVWCVDAAEVSGRPVDPGTTARLRVTYRDDGSWVVLFNGLPVAEGTSHNDPESRPKTFEMQTLAGEKTPARMFIGIYSVEGDIRRLCFVMADKPRPDSFTAPRGSGRILVTLKRDREPAHR